MDYCTLFPEGWWAHCCAAHDDAYAAQIGQAIADNELFHCVAMSAPTPVLAAASFAVAGTMWFGVRLFGRRYYRRAKKSPTQ